MSGAKKPVRRTYDESSKRDAVRLIVEEKHTYARAAEAVGVSEQSLSEWRASTARQPSRAATTLVSDALRDAIEKRKPKRGELLHHSDRGCQHTS